MEKIKFFISNVLLKVGTCTLLLILCINYLINQYIKPFMILNELEKDYELEVAQSEVMYSDIIDYYDEYTTLVANSFEEITGDDLIKTFALYTKLQNEGLLSYGDSFSSTEEEFQIVGYYGINVAVGNGVCRHTADNLYHILYKMGFECERVTGEMYEGVLTGKPNHMLVYVKYRDNIYLLDPTNETIFVKDGKDFVSIKNTKSRFDPSFAHDVIHSFEENNLDVHFGSKDRDKIISSLLDAYQYSEEFSDDYLEFYKDYEHQYLRSYQNKIYDGIEEIKQEKIKSLS